MAPWASGDTLDSVTLNLRHASASTSAGFSTNTLSPESGSTVSVGAALVATAGSPQNAIVANGWLLVNVPGTTAAPTVLTTDGHYVARFVQGVTGQAATLVGDAFSNAAGFQGRSSRGTIGSPSASSANDILAFFTGIGYGATGYASSEVGMNLFAAQAFTDTAQGTYITLFTTLSGGTTGVERVRVTDAGRLLVGLPTDDLASLLQVNGPIKVTGTAGQGLTLQASGGGQLYLSDTAQPTDGKIWGWFANGTALLGRALNDANTVATNWITVTRTGSGVSSVAFGAPLATSDISSNRYTSATTLAASGTTASITTQGMFYFSILSNTTNGAEFGIRSGNTVYRFSSVGAG